MCEEYKLLEELYQKEYGRLYDMALNLLHDEYDAEDALTEVMMSIMGHKVWWEKQNENVRLDYAEKICKKACQKIISERGAVHKVEFVDNKPKKGMDIEFELKLLEHENLIELFGHLREIDREIFTARYIERKSVKDIAATMETSENNISKHLSRGRKELKKLFLLQK